MQTSTFRLDRPDGVSVNVNKWLPDRPVRAVVLIAHGMAEYGARYAHVAKVLTDAGYAVYAPDHRGHGHTVTSPDDLGYMADEGGWLLVVDDLKALWDVIIGEHPGVPRFFYSHSMGSFLTQTFLFRHPGIVDGAVLQGSDSGAFAIYSLLRGVVATEVRLSGPHNRSFVPKLQSVLFNMKFKPKRTVFDWISSDPAEVDAYIADPLCGFDVTSKFWADIGDGMKLNANPHNVDKVPKNLPLFITHGELDPVGDNGKGIKRLLKQYQKAGLTAVEHKTYANLRHEIHNEVDRALVFADLIAWLDRQVAVVEERKSAA